MYTQFITEYYLLSRKIRSNIDYVFAFHFNNADRRVVVSTGYHFLIYRKSLNQLNKTYFVLSHVFIKKKLRATTKRSTIARAYTTIRNVRFRSKENDRHFFKLVFTRDR